MSARSALLERIASLSDDEFARVAPYLEADLETTPDLDELHAAVAAGRISAQTESLYEDAEVRRDARAALKKA